MASTEPSLILVHGDTDSSPVSHSDSDESSGASDAPANVLSSLHRSQPAAINRPPTIHVHSSGDRKRKRCGTSTKLRRKSVHECLREYPGEYLTVDKGVLFCDACRTEVSQKASSIKRHLASKRHGEGKVERKRSAEKQQSIVQAMRMFDREHHPMGETISEKERAFRCEVIETFLKGGVALSKIRHFRPLLERLGTRLADRSTLARMVPLVLSREKGFIKEWIRTSTSRLSSTEVHGWKRLWLLWYAFLTREAQSSNFSFD